MQNNPQLFTREECKACLVDVPANFKRLIDFVLYYDEIDSDEFAWDIIHRLEELPYTKLIELLTKDFCERNLDGKSTLLYNGLFYGLANNPESHQLLRSALSLADSRLREYIVSLNKNKGRDGDINIARLFSSKNDV